jgi:hypothetical protein
MTRTRTDYILRCPAFARACPTNRTQHEIGSQREIIGVTAPIRVKKTGLGPIRPHSKVIPLTVLETKWAYAVDSKQAGCSERNFAGDLLVGSYRCNGNRSDENERQKIRSKLVASGDKFFGAAETKGYRRGIER